MSQIELFNKMITARNSFNPPLSPREIADFVIGTGVPITNWFLDVLDFRKEQADHLKVPIFTKKSQVAHELKLVNQEIEEWVERKSKNIGFIHEYMIEDLLIKRQKIQKIAKFWKPFKKGDITARILKAKQFPITDLIKFNRGGFVKCIAHGETVPSLKYYPQTNTGHCFSCNKTFDSIEIVRILHGKGFLAAINFLSGHDS